MNASRPLSLRNQPRLRSPQLLAWTNTKWAAVNSRWRRSSPSGVSRNRVTDSGQGLFSISVRSRRTQWYKVLAGTSNWPAI